MPQEKLVTEHYTRGELFEAICDGVAALGKSIDDVTIEDLAPVDEFHIGGRMATREFLDQLQIKADSQVLDVGCGIGGGSRFAAHSYGCSVTGIDLTRQYIETGNKLSGWLGLDDRVKLQQSNATTLDEPDGAFDRAYMLHVGMNIEDKLALTTEIFRVLRPGAKFGIYDVMRVGEGDLVFPVPWAGESAGSSVDTIETYKAALEQVGFKLIAERNRKDFALEFFQQMKARAATTKGPPPLGLHLLMGPAAAEKLKNMVENISRNLIAPVELIAEKQP